MSGSNLAKALALVPFGYTAVTRLRSGRDTIYLILSSWLPATWFLCRTGDLGAAEGAALFAMGYLAFIAVYEIGYLANDSWDARKSDRGRRRVPYEVRPPYAALFVLLRILTWGLVGWLTGWIADPVWLAGFGALVIVFAEHNLIGAPGLRSASFFQLAVLRFALPVIAPTPADARLPLLLVAILYYVYLRFLSYLESKDLLRLVERRRPLFSVTQIVMFCPLAALVAFLAAEPAVFELWGYFLLVFVGWAFVEGRLGPGRRKHPAKRP